MPLSCRDVDVLSVGSGFGGSLTALLCRQIGLSPLVIDSGAHPRFAIGESTTPLANLVLESLAHRYRLEALLPFTNYASWTQAHPQIGVGLKRGFSYFHHSRGRPYRPSAPHDSEWLVAASHGPEDADTHWFRADFDHFLVQQLNAQEIPCLERTELVSLSATTDGWRVGTREANGEPRGEITARFLIDASGPGGALARRLSIPDSTAALHTRSRAIYAHFKGVKPWEPLYRNVGGVSGDHPFPADAAALHHVFDGGWMWVLRFDNGVTSARLNPDGDK